MASLVYNLGKSEIMDGSIDFSGDTIKIMLVDSSYVADDAHDYIDDGGADDPIDHELSGTGYNQGGETLSNLAVTEDDTNNRAELDNSVDITWTGIDAGTAAGAIVYKVGTFDTNSTMICYIDTGGFPVVTNGGDLTIQFNAEGILQLT